MPSADLALVSIAQNAGTLIAPSKFYGHLAGTPIALISPKNSYLENLVNSNKLGSFFKWRKDKLKEWILLMEQKMN